MIKLKGFHEVICFGGTRHYLLERIDSNKHDFWKLKIQEGRSDFNMFTLDGIEILLGWTTHFATLFEIYNVYELNDTEYNNLEMAKELLR